MSDFEVRFATKKEAAEVANLHLIASRAAYAGQVPEAHWDATPMAKRVSYWKEAIEYGEPQVMVALEGDSSRGVPACNTCHGTQLTGIQAHVPGLLGLPLDYLNAQLGAWQTSQRKTRTPDCMREIVKQLDSEDLVAVATWLSTQNMPSDTAPASKVSTPLKAPWQCGSAPELSKVQP